MVGEIYFGIGELIQHFIKEYNMVHKTVFLLLFVIIISVFSKDLGGLILNGIDTINVPLQNGFDFVTQTSCTTFANEAPYSCYNHFYLLVNENRKHFDFLVSNGYSIKLGKINLDSIKNAPADSVFYQNFLTIDSISFDSLPSRIGNVYLLKTSPDPRPSFKYPIYAKIKLLKFIVTDSTKHEIQMVFLWTYNRSGYPDLTSSSVDTFHLEPPTINRPENQIARSLNRVGNSQFVFKVVGDRFVVPKDLVGKFKAISVFNFQGKRLGELKNTLQKDQNTLSKEVRGMGKGMMIFKGE